MGLSVKEPYPEESRRHLLQFLQELFNLTQCNPDIDNNPYYKYRLPCQQMDDSHALAMIFKIQNTADRMKLLREHIIPNGRLEEFKKHAEDDISFELEHL